jgi:mRNA interferase RelE/StbE
LNKFRIAEALTFQRKMESRPFQQYYSRIKEHIYPGLLENPYAGPNIKRLKGEFRSIYRYRMGDYRLFYTLDLENRLIFMLDFEARKNAYNLPSRRFIPMPED